MSFGHALYYPHISLTNKNWLKYALLYWDKISRIVPAEVQPEDSEDIIRLRSEMGFVEDYAPTSSDVGRAAFEFFHWLSCHIGDRDLLEYFESRFGPRLDPMVLEHLDHLRGRWRHHGFRNGRPHGILGALNAAARTGGEYIHVQKLDPRLKEFLLATGIRLD